MSKTGNKQMDLIDVAPENKKKIISLAKEYRGIVKERLPLTHKESELKTQILQEVKGAGLQYVNGKIQFTVDGIKITVTPRDEAIKVEEENKSSE